MPSNIPARLARLETRSKAELKPPRDVMGSILAKVMHGIDPEAHPLPPQPPIPMTPERQAKIDEILADIAHKREAYEAHEARYQT